MRFKWGFNGIYGDWMWFIWMIEGTLHGWFMRLYGILISNGLLLGFGWQKNGHSACFTWQKLGFFLICTNAIGGFDGLQTIKISSTEKIWIWRFVSNRHGGLANQKGWFQEDNQGSLPNKQWHLANKSWTQYCGFFQAMFVSEAEFTACLPSPTWRIECCTDCTESSRYSKMQ